jgi:hypothetical protein
VDAILGRAMAKSPENRYQTVGEFAEALRLVRESPAAPMPAPRSTRKARLSPAMQIGIVTLLLALVAAIVYFLTLN